MPIGTEEDPEDADEDSASRVSLNLYYGLHKHQLILFLS
jgi:hypothetical protein